MPEMTIRQMFEAGVHFGHQTRFWNPKMAEYIYTQRNHIHIINLDKTLPMLQSALTFLQNEVANKKQVLFVGTKRPAQDVIRRCAESCEMPYVNCRWLGGMLTNFRTVRQSVKTYQRLLLEEKRTDIVLSKKQALLRQRKIKKLGKTLEGVKDMERLPQILFVIDIRYEQIAILEAKKVGIPIVAIIDTNNSCEGIDYPIPGNDDSISAIDFYATVAAEAIKKGLEMREEQEEITIEETSDVDKVATKKVKVKMKKVAKPDKADSVQADSVQADSAQADSAQADSVQADSAQADSAQADSAQADSAQADSAQADSAQADSAQADSAQADSAQADSEQVNPDK